MQPFRRSLSALLVLCLAACGGSSPAATSTVPPPSIAIVVPSFIPEDATAILRFDGRTTRRTAIAPAISEMISVSGTWSMLSAGSDAHPIDDVDIMLCGARATFEGGNIWSREWFFVLRHPYEDAEVEARISRMGERHQIPVQWQDHDGFRFVQLPVETGGFTAHFLVLTARGEVVVTPESDLRRVLDVARQQKNARHADEAVDPLLATEPEEIVYVRLAPRDGGVVPLGALAPQAAELRAKRHDAQISVSVRLRFISEAEALNAQSLADTMRRQASDNTLARLFGLSRALDSAHVDVVDASLLADALLDASTAGGVARLLAAVQQQRR